MPHTHTQQEKGAKLHDYTALLSITRFNFYKCAHQMNSFS